MKIWNQVTTFLWDYCLCGRFNMALSVHYFALKLHDNVQLQAKVVTAKSRRLMAIFWILEVLALQASDGKQFLSEIPNWKVALTNCDIPYKQKVINCAIRRIYSLIEALSLVPMTWELEFIGSCFIFLSCMCTVVFSSVQSSYWPSHIAHKSEWFVSSVISAMTCLSANPLYFTVPSCCFFPFSFFVQVCGFSFWQRRHFFVGLSIDASRSRG